MVAEDAARTSMSQAAPRSSREQAMIAVRALAPERLGVVLRRALLSLGVAAFLEDVVAPLMEEIGSEWHAERITIAQEHAATDAVVQLLGALARELAVPDAAHVVMATPRGELHIVGAMMAAATASHDGWYVTWLGSDLPAPQIATAAAQGRADVVALSVATDGTGFNHELSALRRKLEPRVPVFVGGAGAGQLAQIDGVTKVRGLAHWRALLRLHAARSRG
jgi:methanogenic corrinoid protein MtbC1